MERYSVIRNKNPREIVLLRGSGCKWKKCTFCDYYKDYSKNADENFRLNTEVLGKVNGEFKKLEVINSGSFCDLDKDTISQIIKTCKEKDIVTVHFECHYLHRYSVAKAKALFAKNGIALKIKTGVETFDIDFRENVLKKGFGGATPHDIANYADEVCLLFGISGQTEESMIYDINTGLAYFDRVCVNIMNRNSTDVIPNENVINVFKLKVMPKYINNDRVDILLDNTDFGVGGKEDEK